MAQAMQSYLQCDLFEIEPTEPYPFTNSETDKRAKEEVRTNARPSIKSSIENLKEYTTIFLGYPVWNGDLPMILYTFMETYGKDLKGKTIYPFCTHEGMNQVQTFKNVQKALPQANVKRGFGLYGKNVDKSESKINQWLKEIL